MFLILNYGDDNDIISCQELVDKMGMTPTGLE